MVLGERMADPSNAAPRAVEDIYQKKSQLEHILLRPDTYVGSIEHQQSTLWVHDGDKIVQRPVSFVPGLYKIFDEILVNAADNKVRDESMDTLRVDVDETTGRIKVWNNGAGVPVEMHKKEQVYVPELIFGHLLTSSNYEDDQKKVTGGRNGYGAKLANIFSTEFVIETCDGGRQKRYRQVFSKNMGHKSEPRITACKPKDNWTCVEFKPDFARFNMDALDDDIVALMRKRTYDLAGVLGKGVKVYYNGARLAVKTFQDYVNLYLGPKDGGAPRVYERVGDRWEVIVSPTDGQFQQVSFVNSICTLKGGTHVKLIVDQICKHLVEAINKKNKNAKVKDFMVKNHLWVFVNCQIENPAFDSQTKETLTLKASSFGSTCKLSAKFMDAVGKSGVSESILAFANFKQNNQLKKTDGAKRSRLTGVPKLDDANEAGGKGSDKCTLILTEGDSAKALAISGLSVVGRDHYGVFPLRGKLLNVRDASATQVGNNAEITALKKIIGLQHAKTYVDTKSLRYGKLMIMTDQDQDGSHIKGLIMNYLHHFYPSLLQVPGFLVEFITPIVKAKQRRGNGVEVFYTMPEYEAWKETVNTKLWAIKYYKGLGTSDSKEAKEYFADLDHHRKTFLWEGAEDGECLELAFSKKKVEQRKQWLRDFVPGTFLDHSQDDITFRDFVHQELILFSRADLLRSIPSMCDGLKPGQRKILFSCFKRNLKADVKVAQLAGYVSEHAAYHHGEASLQATIVGLAQDYVSSNNVNLLHPSGQFGTRLQGGKDSASARYIFTRLALLTRHLFNEADDPLLVYQTEEGERIEPEWYLPILPLVLVNGAEGIGTGWSTSIPNYNPLDIVANVRRLLAGGEAEAMTPWYRGFTGEILETPAARNAMGKSYFVSGNIEQLEGGEFRITELPLRKWTQDYKEFLESMVKPDDKNATPLVLDYREHHTDTTVDFTVTMTPAGLKAVQEKGMVAFFKLQSKMSTSNMVLFDASGQIAKYNSPEHILSDFFTIRLDFYDKRRASLLSRAQDQLLRISNKVKFILAVVNGELVVSGRKRRDIEADLTAGGYDRMAKTDAAAARRGGGATPSDTEEGEESDPEAAAAAAPGDGKSYDYLLGMSISTLTHEKVQALESERDEKEAHVARLQRTTREQLWSEDLDGFEAAYAAWLADAERSLAELAENQRKAKARNAKKGKAAAKKPAKKKKRALDDSDASSDMSDEDDDFAPVKKAAPKKAAAPKPAAAKTAAPKPAAPKAAAPAKAAEKAAPKGEGARKNGDIQAMFAKAKASPGWLDDSTTSDDAGPSASAPKPAKKTAAAAKPKAAARSRAVALTDSEEGDGDDSSEGGDWGGSGSDSDAPPPKKKQAAAPAKPKAAPKPAAKAKAAPSKVLDSDDDLALSPVAVAPAPKPAAAKPRKKAAAPPPREPTASPAASDSDGENDAAGAGPSRRAAPRRGAATAKKQYVDMLSDDEDGDEGSASEAAGSESDGSDFGDMSE